MSSPIAAPSSATPPQESQPQFDFLTWFELNRLPLLCAVGVVFGAVVISLFIRDRRESQEKSANAELMRVLGTGVSNAAPSAAELLRISESYRGSQAAQRARLLAAGQYFSSGKYSEAAEEFKKFVADFPDSPLASTAALGVASSLDAANKTSEAITAYQSVITGYGTDPLVFRAKLDKARLHEALNQWPQAMALYDELAATPTAGMMAQEAGMQRAQLITKHPELDKPLTLTNSVKVVAPAKPASSSSSTKP